MLCEDFLIYKSFPLKQDLKCKYPRRLGINSNDKVLINCYALHKQKGHFFYLIQTEYGDLLKVMLNYTAKDVHNIAIQYLDTIHPANSICILKSGYFLAAADSGNQYFLFIKHFLEIQKSR